MSEDRSRGERCSQRIKRGLGFFGPSESFDFGLPQECRHGSHHFAEMLDKPPIKISQAQEHPNVMNRLGGWPGCDHFDFGWVHLDAVGTH